MALKEERQMTPVLSILIENDGETKTYRTCEEYCFRKELYSNLIR